MRRFYIQSAAITSAEPTLDHEESRHITKVLRLQPGSDVELYDGTGFLYQATITEVGKAVGVAIQSKEYFKPPRPAIILHAGLLKNKKMELVLQKATELGVAEVQLFSSDHTTVTLPDQKKIQRYQKIISESCKQSERLHPMTVRPTTPLQEHLQEIAGQRCCYLFWEREQLNDLAMITDLELGQDIHLFTGPEGGFSPAEISTLPATVQTISLGKQILRAETAVLTAVSVVSFLAGRLNP